MRRVGLALLLLFLCHLPLVAQNDHAMLSGTVSDAKNHRIPAAEIEVKALATGLEYHAVSNSAGVYAVNALPIGDYTAVVIAPGFEKLEFEPFTLQVGENRVLNISMAVAKVNTVVQVAAEDDLNRASTTVGGVIGGTQISELPMDGRSFERLESQVPGAIDDAGSTEDQIRFAGESQEDNNFQMDGIDAGGINHQFEKVDLRLQVPVEGIAEFRASSFAYSADQGGAAGGQVQLVTKSGTSEFHGSVWEYLRNSDMDATTWNSTGHPQLQLNNFGANFGGPAIKNKVFFFANWGAYRQRLAQQVTGLAPTAAYRSAAIAVSPALAPIINSFVSGGVPTTDPNALSFSGSGSNPVEENAGMARVDYKISDHTSVFARYATDHYNYTSPNGIEVNSNGQLSTQFNSLTSPNVVLDATHTFSPTIFTDARVGVNRDEYHEGGDQVLTTNFSVTGFSTLSTPAADDRFDTSINFVDDTTFVKGRNVIKTGGLVRRVQEDKNTPKIPVITATYIGESQFENNQMDSYAYQGFSNMTGQRQTEYGVYAMDTIRIKQNLMVNAGIRYDYWTVDHDVLGRGVVVDPNTCPSLVCPAKSSWYFPDYTNVGPRLAMTWSPEFMHNKMVISAGGGIFYGQGQFGHLGSAVGNIPQNYTLLETSIPALSYPVTPYLGAAAYSASYTGQNRNRQNFAVDEWTLGIQQEIARETTATVTYIGSSGSHLWSNTIANGVNPATGTRPFAGFSTFTEEASQSHSSFNALEAGIHRNLRTGLMLAANYQWSHAIDDDSVGGAEATTPQNQACLSCDRASSVYDMRHYFTSSAIWQIPVGRNHAVLGSAGPVMNAIVGGWELSGVGTSRAGLPLNITISRSASALPDQINSNQRPNIVLGTSIYPTHRTPQNWLNYEAFSVPANKTWGDEGANIANAPGHWQMDTALRKQFQLGERMSTTFRAEAFNVFNVAQYGNPVVKLTTQTVGGQLQVAPGTFGLINSAFNTNPTGSGTPRQLELSLRLDF
ncbi:TonB-dependent receptor domain-containing protein [Acidicapsa dinghuensis]|uniref:TonB-dependent receptor domain-containing protein n=1 Tax=Acidicapsa dinghuensis TaxID=2218256 RepID=A0ABW1EBY9_9BACT|nr:TonB-dependent receptor [Acidicapsa dinghuensis]